MCNSYTPDYQYVLRVHMSLHRQGVKDRSTKTDRQTANGETDWRRWWEMLNFLQVEGISRGDHCRAGNSWVTMETHHTQFYGVTVTVYLPN